MQVEFSPMHNNTGLSDGEVMERLWSYLRRFSRMTKEMRPSHRIDVLSHALLYYSSLKTDKLGRITSYLQNVMPQQSLVETSTCIYI